MSARAHAGRGEEERGEEEWGGAGREREREEASFGAPCHDHWLCVTYSLPCVYVFAGNVALCLVMTVHGVSPPLGWGAPSAYLPVPWRASHLANRCVIMRAVGHLRSGTYCRTAPRTSQRSRAAAAEDYPQSRSLKASLPLPRSRCLTPAPGVVRPEGKCGQDGPLPSHRSLTRQCCGSRPVILSPALPLPLECFHPSAIQCLSSITDIARKVRAGRAGGARSGCAQRGSTRRFIPWVS